MLRKPRFELTVETSNMTFPWFWRPKVFTVLLGPSVDVSARWGFTRATVKFWLE